MKCKNMDFPKKTTSENPCFVLKININIPTENERFFVGIFYIPIPCFFKKFSLL